MTLDVWAWRHPRAIGAVGRCIGRTDLCVDRRKAKRLAGRIRALARRNSLPHEIWTSPLIRCAEVGRVLRAWGWTHRIDERLAELDFGTWDGRRWSRISHAEVAAWEADFLHHPPGGGESQAALRARVARFVDGLRVDASTTPRPSGPPMNVLVVSHAGWIAALAADDACEDASRWPKPLPPMGLQRVRLPAPPRASNLETPT